MFLHGFVVILGHLGVISTLSVVILCLLHHSAEWNNFVVVSQRPHRDFKQWFGPKGPLNPLDPGPVPGRPVQDLSSWIQVFSCRDARWFKWKKCRGITTAGFGVKANCTFQHWDAIIKYIFTTTGKLKLSPATTQWVMWDAHMNWEARKSELSLPS